MFRFYAYFLPRTGRTDWAASARADLVLAVADRAVLHTIVMLIALVWHRARTARKRTHAT